MFIGGFAFSFVHAPWKVEGTWDSQAYLYAAFIVFFGTLIPFYFYLTAVQLIGGQKSSLLASGEPLSATILAVLWLHVPFTLMDWIGSIFIISTIFLLSYEKKKRKTKCDYRVLRAFIKSIYLNIAGLFTFCNKYRTGKRFEVGNFFIIGRNSVKLH